MARAVAVLRHSIAICKMLGGEGVDPFKPRTVRWLQQRWGEDFAQVR